MFKVNLVVAEEAELNIGSEPSAARIVAAREGINFDTAWQDHLANPGNDDKKEKVMWLMKEGQEELRIVRGSPRGKLLLLL
jgi:hypothetical protein